MVLSKLVGCTRTVGVEVASASRAELVRKTETGDVAVTSGREGLGVGTAVEERDSAGLLVGEGLGGSSADEQM